MQQTKDGGEYKTTERCQQPLETCICTSHPPLISSPPTLSCPHARVNPINSNCLNLFCICICICASSDKTYSHNSANSIKSIILYSCFAFFIFCHCHCLCTISLITHLPMHYCHISCSNSFVSDHPPSPKLTKKHILNEKCCLLFWPKWNRQNHYTHCLGDIKVQQNNEGKYLILAMRAV